MHTFIQSFIFYCASCELNNNKKRQFYCRQREPGCRANSLQILHRFPVFSPAQGITLIHGHTWIVQSISIRSSGQE
jgi:hypothetical protein